MGCSRFICGLLLPLFACLLVGCWGAHGRTADSSSEDTVEVAEDADGISDISVEEIHGPPECTYEELRAFDEAVAVAPESEPCFSGSVIIWEEGGLEASVDLTGSSLELYCGPEGYTERLQEREARVEEAFSVMVPECTPRYGGHVAASRGLDLNDYYRMLLAFEETCPGLWSGERSCDDPLEGTEITLDDDGYVVDAADAGWAGCMIVPEVLDCIMTALDGMTFPCLAGFVICPTQAWAP